MLQFTFLRSHRVLRHIAFVDDGIISKCELSSGGYEIENRFLALIGRLALAHLDAVGINSLFAFSACQIFLGVVGAICREILTLDRLTTLSKTNNNSFSVRILLKANRDAVELSLTLIVDTGATSRVVKLAFSEQSLASHRWRWGRRRSLHTHRYVTAPSEAMDIGHVQRHGYRSRLNAGGVEHRGGSEAARFVARFRFTFPNRAGAGREGVFFQLLLIRATHLRRYNHRLAGLHAARVRAARNNRRVWSFHRECCCRRHG